MTAEISDQNPTIAEPVQQTIAVPAQPATAPTVQKAQPLQQGVRTCKLFSIIFLFHKEN